MKRGLSSIESLRPRSSSQSVSQAVLLGLACGCGSGSVQAAAFGQR